MVQPLLFLLGLMNLNYWKITVDQKQDSGIPSFFKGKSDPKLSPPRNIDGLKIDQRVVTFGDEDIPRRGTVRYINDVEDSRGDVQILVGLELVSSPQSHGFAADCFCCCCCCFVFYIILGFI